VPALAGTDVDARVRDLGGDGITAVELASRLPHRVGTKQLGADAIERWLRDAGLAEHDGVLLRPTALALTVAGAIDL
jgi:hypothetical protein